MSGKLYPLNWCSCCAFVALAVASSSVPATAQVWNALPSMPTARSQAAVAAVDGEIHVIGGASATSTVNTHEVFDPSAGAWRTAAPIPRARRGMGSAVGPDGKIYVFGGTDPTNTLYIYDPAGDSWDVGADLPNVGIGSGWECEGDFGADGKLYVFGGEWAPTETRIYTPATNSWASGAPLPAGRAQHGVFRGSDALFYIVGGTSLTEASRGSAGLDESGPWELADDMVYVYDPVANSWGIVPPVPAQVNSFGEALSADRAHYYVIGGSTEYGNDNPPYFDSVYRFDVSSQTWATPTAMPTGRRELMAANVNGSLYAIGGSNGAKLDTNEGTLRAFPGPVVDVGGIDVHDNQILLVVEQEGAVFVLSATDGTLLRTVALPGFSDPDPGSYGIAVAGGIWWHSDYQRSALYRLDPSDGSVLGQLPMPQPYLGIAWTGSELWGASPSEHEMYRINTTTGAILQTVPLPTVDGPLDMTWDDSLLWVSERDGNEVHRVTAAGTIVRTEVAPGPVILGIAADNPYMWLGQNGVLWRFDYGLSVSQIFFDGFESGDTGAWSATQGGE